MVQEYTSRNTSINKTRVPKLFGIVAKYFGWQAGTTNLDIGGGKYDTATVFLSEFGVQNFIYDKYNRTRDENLITDLATWHEAPDTVTVSNVLNVIREQAVRFEVLKLAKKKVKTGGYVYISVYNSGKHGESKPDCWQNAMDINDYLQEVQSVFPMVWVQHGIIIAQK